MQFDGKLTALIHTGCSHPSAEDINLRQLIEYLRTSPSLVRLVVLQPSQGPRNAEALETKADTARDPVTYLLVLILIGIEDTIT